MSQKSTKFMGSFVAKYADGRAVTVEIYQQFIRTDTFSGSSESPGLKELRLTSGEHVNRKDKGIYETLWGEKLTSDDPNAP